MGSGDLVIENYLPACATGVLVGCLYGLMCAGPGMISIMRAINVAQGGLMMLGMYSA